MVKVSAAALETLLQEAAVELDLQEAHAALIKMALVTIGAVSDTLSLGPIEWLEDVARGYGARFAGAFARAGFDSVDAIVQAQPLASTIASVLAMAGGQPSQIQRVVAALVNLSGISHGWLDTHVQAGYALRFGDAFFSAGYASLEDVRRTQPSAFEIASLLSQASTTAAAASAATTAATPAQPPQVQLIIAALAKADALAHGWLDAVKAGSVASMHPLHSTRVLAAAGERCWSILSVRWHPHFLSGTYADTRSAIYDVHRFLYICVFQFKGTLCVSAVRLYQLGGRTPKTSSSRRLICKR